MTTNNMSIIMYAFIHICTHTMYLWLENTLYLAVCTSYCHETLESDRCCAVCYESHCLCDASHAVDVLSHIARAYCVDVCHCAVMCLHG